MNFITHIQGDPYSSLTPLFLVHAISGVALPYFALDSLSDNNGDVEDGRPVYGISSPVIARRNGRMAMTFEELAELYIHRIKKEIQPTGPYLLGGWSFGGMIAMKMAEILQNNNEDVLHVIMMDSPNPSKYPKFQNNRELEGVTTVTFGNVVQSVGRSSLCPDGESTGPMSCEDSDSDVSSDEGYPSPGASSDAEDEYGLFGTPAPTQKSFASGIDSNNSSDDEDNSPYSSDCEESNNTDSRSLETLYGYDEEEEDEGVFGAELFSRIQNHITGGLKLISRTKGDFYTPSRRCKFPVTLVKCKVLEPLNPLINETRKKFILKMFDDELLGWNEDSFEKGINVVHVQSAHDRMFDRRHSEELSDVLRQVIIDVEYNSG